MKEKTIGQIDKALTEVTKTAHSISTDSHLVKDGILDSLDSAAFLYELEIISGKKIPEQDVIQKDLFKVENLVKFLEPSP